MKKILYLLQITILFLLSSTIVVLAANPIVLAGKTDEILVTDSQFQQELLNISIPKRKLLKAEDKLDILEVLVGRLLVDRELATQPLPKSPLFLGRLTELTKRELLSIYTDELHQQLQVTDEVILKKKYETIGSKQFPGKSFLECREQIRTILTLDKLASSLQKIGDTYLNKHPLTTGEITLFFTENKQVKTEEFYKKTLFYLENADSISFLEGTGMIDVLEQEGQKLDLSSEKIQNYLLERLLKQGIVYREILESKLIPLEIIKEKKQTVQENLTRTWFLSQNIKKIEINENTTKELYKKNPEWFKTGGDVQLQILQVSSVTEGEDLAKRLQKGEDFTSLATQHSIHPTASNGGVTNFFKLPAEGPDYLRPVHFMKENQTSELIAAKDGYFIIRLLKKNPVTVIPYDQVKDKLRALLTRDTEWAARKEFFEELRKKHQIQLFPDRIK
jgi:peptidyl-prolyl cis-trans isomerase C